MGELGVRGNGRGNTVARKWERGVAGRMDWREGGQVKRRREGDPNTHKKFQKNMIYYDNTTCELSPVFKLQVGRVHERAR